MIQAAKPLDANHLAFNGPQPNSYRVTPTLCNKNEPRFYANFTALDGFDRFQYELWLDVTRSQVDDSHSFLPGIERKHSKVTVVSYHDSTSVECLLKNLNIIGTGEPHFLDRLHVFAHDN